MGIFSKHHRYREEGQQPNVNNVMTYGRPYRSLFTSTKIFSMRHHIDITDDQGYLAYQANTRAISFTDKTSIVDARGMLVAQIERKVFSIHESHYITLANGPAFVLSKELFHIYNNIMNIDGLGWQLRGNIYALNFQLYDAMGRIVAVISQKWISMHDKYCVDLYQPGTEPAVIAILVTLQHMIIDRENRQRNTNNNFGG